MKAKKLIFDEFGYSQELIVGQFEIVDTRIRFHPNGYDEVVDPVLIGQIVNSPKKLLYGAKRANDKEEAKQVCQDYLQSIVDDIVCED